MEILTRDQLNKLIDLYESRDTFETFLPKVINKFAKDIAIYNLFSRRGIDENSDEKNYLNRYNAAIKFLTFVAEGKVSIGASSDDPAAAAITGFTVVSSPRLFNRDQLRGM